MPHLITWFEIPVFDFDRGVNFYSNVFRHISFDLADFNGVRHAIFKSAVPSSPLKMTGALVETQDKGANLCGPVLFFDANLGMSHILQAIKAYGGEIILEKTLIRNLREDGSIVIPKTQIDGSSGYYAYFKDSEGNKMGLYSNS
jgi:uncharacterized protein